MASAPEIFFHIGLGKTGTTFLQYRAFPFFQGLEYIQRTRFRKAKEIIQKSESTRFFISFECDQQLEEVAKDWAKDHPQTTPIIVFRKHDSWIASQFRRFVKNCHVRSFKELLDIQSDTGIFKKKDLEFYAMIEMLEETFQNKAIVLLYDDMRTDPQSFIRGLARRMDSSIDLHKVDFSKKHSSYSEKQLKGLLCTQRFISLKKRVVFKNKVIEFFRKTGVNGTRYLILFLSSLMPNSWFSTAPLLPKEELKAVQKEFDSDWDRILDRADRF